MADIHLAWASSQTEQLACFSLMQALRPHLTDGEQFVRQVQRQAQYGYRLLAAWQEGMTIGLAGYRLQENLVYGRFLYVDDLVCQADVRGQGIGDRLMQAMYQEAARERCAHLVLDSALSNALAHRFYFRQGLLARALRFSAPIHCGEVL
ncbi:GNAT family N-acetyltransferase [Dickeya solani]|uniref:GNAT family N-acetyltransferase n=1 Tax=Dickeya solani TaxID=1089444 RepID=A0AAX4F5J3_9GAMM|nr:GNAT family N-acetyltransferase [Dickeya solani]WOA54197.1 GNAT family N-acetyltransferase [Dickeya solani]